MADADEQSEAPEASEITTRADADDDPRARWRALPDRIPPHEWVTEKPVPAVPGSVQAAEDQWQQRQAWQEIRWWGPA